MVSGCFRHIVGDVNQALDSVDKKGGRPIDQLIDMDFQEPRFTWTNGREGLANIKVILDRAWCNYKAHMGFKGLRI